MLFRLVSLTLLVILSLQTHTIRCSSNEFCLAYNCKCSNSNREINCKLNSTIKSLHLNLSRDATLVDLSNNNLEQVSFRTSQPGLSQLLLSSNKLKRVDEAFLAQLDELAELDLSNNVINLMQETAFKNLHSKLVKLNLSNAFNSNYALTRELCELISLKALDLSYLNLANFSLECWQSQPGQIEYLYLKNAQNIQKSWSKWYPYIGKNLKLIDLTSSNLITIDSNLSKQTHLVSLILANNRDLEEASLFKVLQSDNLIGRLIELNLANISAANSSLSNLIDHSGNGMLSLERLDISNNDFSSDLNAFLFNQVKFKNLKSFKASKNKFKKCEQTLITIKNLTLLDNLETLDLSFNSLEGSKCLYSIKTITTLQALDLSHNRLSLIESDVPDLYSMFEYMVNLSSIDLSHNLFTQLTFYLNPYHTRISQFDMSFNNLKSFRFISKHAYESAKYPFNLNDDMSEYEDNEEEDDDMIISIDNKHYANEHDDDDERYLVLGTLNLSHNNFHAVNLQHMLQSVRNARNVDLSSNPIEVVIRLSNERDIIRQDEKIDQDDLTEILCIDLLDLANCQIKRVPNLEHICINKLNLAYNQIAGNTHVLMSNFSMYFTDYINLQYNNITKLKLGMSEQKFKQDLYLKKNSPNHYYFGDTTTHNLVHTYIDLNNNHLYTCDCAQIRFYKETTYVQLLHECLNEPAFKQQCNLMSADNQKLTMYTLNRKFRILFVITCGLLMILSGLIVYYMCSDCVHNMQPYSTIRFNWKKVIHKIRAQEAGNDSESSSNVHYSRLQNDLMSSSNNINLNI